MKEVDDHMQNCDFVRITHVLDKKLWDQFKAIEKEVERANQKAEEVEAKVKKMEGRMQLEKTKLGALLNAKYENIHAPNNNYNNSGRRRSRRRKRSKNWRCMFRYKGNIMPTKWVR